MILANIMIKIVKMFLNIKYGHLKIIVWICYTLFTDRCAYCVIVFFNYYLYYRTTRYMKKYK